MADVKISGLVAVTALLGVDSIEVVQSGVNKKCAVSLIQEANASLSRYSTLTGNGGSTVFEITHNLNTRKLHVSVRQSVTPWASVTNYTSECTTLDKVTLRFATPPAASGVEVFISK